MSIFTDSELASLQERAIRTYADDTYSRNIILAHVQREKLGGKSHPIAIRLGGGSVGANFVSARAQNKSVERAEANITPKLLYGFGSVTGYGEAASQGENAIVELMGDEESNTRGKMAQRLEKFIVDGAGYGTLLVVASFTGTTGAVTITAKNANDLVFVQVQDELVIKDVENTASLRTGFVTVTGVDPVTGIISGTMGGGGDLTGLAAGAVVGNVSDMANSATPSTIIGFRGWLTRSFGTADFEGLTAAQRAANPVGLAGWVFNVGSMSVRDTVNKLTNAQFAVQGADPNIVLMGVDSFQEIQDDLGDQVRFTDPSKSSATVDVNFEGIRFRTAAGRSVDLYPHSALNKDIYSLDTKWLHLVSPEAELMQPRNPRSEDRGWILLHDSDTSELHLRTQACFGMSFPSAQARAIRS
jgi:hypothetical protein